MNIVVNGDKEQIDKETLNITELLKIKEVEMPEMVSVQLNSEFIERENFDTQKVEEDDEIDFLYFMGGGSKEV